MCGACHDLDDCSIFMSLTVENRSKGLLLRLKLYSGCYGCISKDHSGRNCKQRRSCKICEEKLQTGLHGLKPKKEGVREHSANSDNK